MNGIIPYAPEEKMIMLLIDGLLERYFWEQFVTNGPDVNGVMSGTA